MTPHGLTPAQRHALALLDDARSTGDGPVDATELSPEDLAALLAASFVERAGTGRGGVSQFSITHAGRFALVALGAPTGTLRAERARLLAYVAVANAALGIPQQQTAVVGGAIEHVVRRLGGATARQVCVALRAMGVDVEMNTVQPTMCRMRAAGALERAPGGGDGATAAAVYRVKET